VAFRDEHGHFITREEAERRGLTEPRQLLQREETEETGEATPDEWAATAPEEVRIETGRGDSVGVPVGAPFQGTVERIADEAHYGGYFRVFLNGSEVVNPSDAPELIEAGQRITLTSYDKVG